MAAAIVAITKGLDATESIVGKIKRLYDFAFGDKKKEAKNEEPLLTERERILAMLFDAYLDNRKSLSGLSLAARCGISHEDAQEILLEFEQLDITRKRENEWIFSTKVGKA